MWSLTHGALRRPIKVGRTCSNDDVCSTMYYILYPGALRFTLRPICLVHFATVPFDCVINMFHCITLTCILLIINRAVGKQSAVTVLVSVGKYFVIIVRFRNQKPGAAHGGPLAPRQRSFVPIGEFGYFSSGIERTETPEMKSYLHFIICIYNPINTSFNMGHSRTSNVGSVGLLYYTRQLCVGFHVFKKS